jgi:hypothetical protein
MIVLFFLIAVQRFYKLSNLLLNRELAINNILINKNIRNIESVKLERDVDALTKEVRFLKKKLLNLKKHL